ncbi:hypothetical protein ACYZTX_29095 [Pseudomonas sp. MDT1-17]
MLRKLYLDGIGTQAGAKDSSMGLGTGRGATGVAGRVQLAFIGINGVIQEIVETHPDMEIRSLTFDTFGFSRGAAARHLAKRSPWATAAH